MKVNFAKEGGESLKVIDAYEGLEIEILQSDFKGTSALWVTQRVKDDEASVTANIFSIRGIDLTDSFNFLVTPV